MAYRFTGTGFLPEMDEGAFVLDYWTPGGTALDETDRMIHQVETLLARTPEIEATSRRTGAELGLFATEQNRGDMVVRMRANRSASTQECDRTCARLDHDHDAAPARRVRADPV